MALTRRSFFALVTTTLAAFSVAACTGGGGGGIPGVPHPTPTPTSMPNVHVLVVANSAIPDSETLAQTYMSGRHIPPANLVSVALSNNPNTFTILQTDLQATLFPAVAKAIASLHAAGSRIDFVVMMYGMPYLVNSGSFSGYSVDGILTQATGAFPSAGALFNPYYGSTAPFSSDTYHMVLVTRLDGRSIADVSSLIQQGLAGDGTHPHG